MFEQMETAILIKDIENRKKQLIKDRQVKRVVFFCNDFHDQLYDESKVRRNLQQSSCFEIVFAKIEKLT